MRPPSAPTPRERPPLPRIELHEQPRFARALDRIATRCAGVDLRPVFALPWPAPAEDPEPQDDERAALPAHLGRVDGTWLAVDGAGNGLPSDSPALYALPGAMRANLARLLDAPAPSPADAPPDWWVRAAARRSWAHLVDMPAEDPDAEAPVDDAPALLRALPRQPPERLRQTIVRLGIGPFGGLLSRTPERAAAAACTGLPTPLRRAVWEARAQGPGPSGSRELLASFAGGGEDPAALLFALGARLLGAFLGRHSPLALQQCAQLLPRPAGRALLGSGYTTPPDLGAVHSALSRATDP